MALDGMKQLIDDLAAFDFGQELRTIVIDNEAELPELLKVQLAGGKDGNNEDVTLYGSPNYARATISEKKINGRGLGAVTDRITNYMNGDFYRLQRAKVEGNIFSVDSPVSYFDDIVERSGEPVMELNEESRLKFATEITLPAIEDVLYAKTGLQITKK